MIAPVEFKTNSVTTFDHRGEITLTDLVEKVSRRVYLPANETWPVLAKGGTRSFTSYGGEIYPDLRRTDGTH